MVQIHHSPFQKVCLKESFTTVTRGCVSILGAPSLYINTGVHLVLNLIALSFQKALSDTISHPAFTSGPATSESRIPGHCLPAVVAKCDSPQLLLCVLLYDRGLPDHSEPFRAQSLPGNKKLLDATCWDQGHLLVPRITSLRVRRCAFLLVLRRGPSPHLHKGSPRIKKLTENQRTAKPCIV